MGYVGSNRIMHLVTKTLLISILAFSLVIQPLPNQKHHQEAEAAVITVSAAALAGFFISATLMGVTTGYLGWAADNLKPFPSTERERLEFSYELVRGGTNGLLFAMSGFVVAALFAHFAVGAGAVTIASAANMIAHGHTTYETAESFIIAGNKLYNSIVERLGPVVTDYLANNSYTTPTEFIGNLKDEITAIATTNDFRNNVLPEVETLISEGGGTVENASALMGFEVTDSSGNIPLNWTVADSFKVQSTINPEFMGTSPAGSSLATSISWYVYNYSTQSWSFLDNKSYAMTGSSWYSPRVFSSGAFTGAELLTKAGLSAGDTRPVLVSPEWAMTINGTSVSSGSYHAGVTDPTDVNQRGHLLAFTIHDSADLVVAPSSVIFSVNEGDDPSSQQLAIKSGSSRVLSYTINESISWLSLSKSSGATDDTVTLNVDSDQLNAGTYEGTITVNCTDPAITRYVNIRLMVKEDLDPSNPTADAYVGYPDSNSNYGTRNYMYVGGYALGNNQYFPANGFLKFDVPRSNQTVTNAVLRVYCSNVSGSGGYVAARQVSGSWSEGSITDNNDPTNYYRTSSNRVTSSGWEEWDVTSAVQTWVDGTYANNGFRLYLPPADGLLTFSTKESSQKPELIIEYFNDSQNPNLVISTPEPDGNPVQPFKVGQSVMWETTVANEGPGDSESTRVGFWLTNSPSVPVGDPDEDQGIKLLTVSDSETEDWTYVFQNSDIGAGKYLVVKADWELEQPETDDNDNVAYYGPFSVVAPPEYSLGVTSSSANIAPGGTGSYMVKLTPETGFTSSVTLSVTGLPAGVTASFSNTTLTPGGTTVSTLTLTATDDVVEDTHAFTLQGVGGGVTKTVSMTANVSTPPVVVPSCPVTLSPAIKYNSHLGRTYQLTITPQDETCTWEATSDVSWLRMKGLDEPSYAGFLQTFRGTGSKVLLVGINENSGDARTGVISVGGQTATVYQAALMCGYQLSAYSHTISSQGGSFDVSMTATDGCEWGTNWAPDWITFSANGGRGSGTVTITVAENTGDARSAGLSIGGLSFRVTQEAASANVQSLAGPLLLLLGDTMYSGPAKFPLADIVVDGNYSDWDSIDPLARSQGTTNVPGADVEYTKFAYSRDGKYLYILLKVTDAIHKDVVYRFFFDNDQSCEVDNENGNFQLDFETYSTGNDNLTGHDWAVTSQEFLSTFPYSRYVELNEVMNVSGSYIEARVDAVALSQPDGTMYLGGRTQSWAPGYNRYEEWGESGVCGW